MEATGLNGQLVLLDNKIVIKRKGAWGFLTQGLKGDKEIYIKQISSIQFKPGGSITNGFIQFAFSGGDETKGGLFDAVNDENSIMFKKKQNGDFLKIKELIEEKREQISTPSIIQVSTTSDVPDQIKKLADLRDSGILTEEEFSAKKKQLLGI
ncbi:hypothetical protein AWM68_17945 [Fictibacillus phosphorivorans]|uniref:SHOCT domain-containing protein n=1 Tax=Fictibacillus phosphorivorans TaxID=1221500 RepID=A0A161RTV3_9BACL|nr:SHOCT domain-containing protein [Fictibacillus phosphorivorans]KZE67656.1 hypothetical protein AWM68_17945 [Fictibacillus phosphorivorans]